MAQQMFRKETVLKSAVQCSTRPLHVQNLFFFRLPFPFLSETFFCRVAVATAAWRFFFYSSTGKQSIAKKGKANLNFDCRWFRYATREVTVTLWVYTSIPSLLRYAPTLHNLQLIFLSVCFLIISLPVLSKFESFQTWFRCLVRVLLCHQPDCLRCLDVSCSIGHDH